MGFVAIALLSLLACAFVWSLLDAGKHHDRYERLYDERRWRRVHLWVWGITLAAVGGAVAGGASVDALGVIAVVGLCAGYVSYRFWLAARMNRTRQQWFRDRFGR